MHDIAGKRLTLPKAKVKSENVLHRYIQTQQTATFMNQKCKNKQTIHCTGHWACTCSISSYHHN